MNQTEIEKLHELAQQAYHSLAQLLTTTGLVLADDSPMTDANRQRLEEAWQQHIEDAFGALHATRKLDW